MTGPLAYRNVSDGTKDTDDQPYLYGYSFALDPTRTVKRITLPSNGNVVVFAMALVKAPTSASYSLAASPGSLSLKRGGNISTSISVGSTTGFNGSVSLTASGLPGGVTAAFSPTSTTGASVLTLTAGSTATLGSASFTVTATSGALSQNVTVTLTVQAAPTVVNLASSYNLAGIFTDGTSFSNGGLDGGGYAYSASLIGPAVTWNGIPFTIGAANTSNVVTASGQTIPLPTGMFSALAMLATAENGVQPSQTFRVNYTDGTSTPVIQGISEWYDSRGYPGESVAMVQAYRNYSNGTSQYLQGSLYGYTLPINDAKIAYSVTLPNDHNVKVLALTLVPSGTDAGVVTLSVADGWRLRYFNSTANAGIAADGADPDGDGISNLLERALGLDPTIASAGGLPKVSVDTATGHLVLTATRGGPNATDFVFTGEASADLLTWTTNNVTVLVNNATSYQIRDDGPASPRRFLRLRVTQP